jgi:hypothetical protein
MPSVYPGAVDAFSDPLSNSPLSSPSHSQLHTDVNDALEKIEAYVPRRNLVYNGAMQIHQRGTSTTGITTGNYYTADRWNFFLGSLGTWTQTVENDAPTGSGFRKSFKVLCTTASASPAAGGYCLLQQLLEGQDLQMLKKGTSSAEQLTLSFWVKANVTGTYVCQLRDDDNARSVSATYTVSASGTWEQKTITFPADTTGVLDNDNAGSFRVRWWFAGGSTYTSGTLNTTWQNEVNGDIAPGQVNLGAATNNYWQVTGVQMNVGAVAAPFQFKSYSQDLAECQRYYYRNVGDTAFAPFNIDLMYVPNAVTTSATFRFEFPVPMRARPTAIDTSALATIQIVSWNAGAGSAPNGIVLSGQGSTSAVAIDVTTAGAFYNNTQGFFMRCNNSAGAYIGVSAEL